MKPIISNNCDVFYVDIGNSQVKVARYIARTNSYDLQIISPSKPVASVDVLDNYWKTQGWTSPHSVIFVMSVVPLWKETFQEFAAFKGYQANFIINKTQAHSCFKNNAIINRDIDTIGEDLLVLSYYGSKHLHDCIIINCGTATTYTVVKKGDILGYVLMPGVELSVRALVNHAALLKPVPLQQTTAFLSFTTQGAIGIGAINIVWKGILQHLTGIKEQYFSITTSPVRIIFTGFNTNHFRHVMEEYQHNIDDALSAKALKFWWDTKKPSR